MEPEKQKNYAPAITSTEIVEWENKFKQLVSPLVEYDVQDNGQSMKLYSGLSGIEANWSGTIMLKADNFIKWSFSLQNGAFVEAKFTIDLDNNELIGKLYEFFQQWRDNWSKMLSIPPTANSEGPDAAAIQESRTKGSIIKDHSERMKRLAGLY